MRWSRITLILITAPIFSGCALFSSHAPASAAKSKGDLFIVTAEQTAFYRHQPKKERKPDQEIARDTLVTVIRHRFGYSKVRLATGQQGFVANDALVRASNTLVGGSDAGSESDDSLAATPDVSLPSADPSTEPDSITSTPQLLP